MDMGRSLTNLCWLIANIRNSVHFNQTEHPNFLMQLSATLLKSLELTRSHLQPMGSTWLVYFSYICHINQPNVGKIYQSHGSHGLWESGKWLPSTKNRRNVSRPSCVSASWRLPKWIVLSVMVPVRGDAKQGIRHAFLLVDTGDVLGAGGKFSGNWLLKNDNSRETTTVGMIHFISRQKSFWFVSRLLVTMSKMGIMALVTTWNRRKKSREW